MNDLKDKDFNMGILKKLDLSHKSKRNELENSFQEISFT